MTIHLPGERSAKAAGPQLFPPGTLVRLASCPSGLPGRVLRVERGRVLVYWRDLDYTGRHAPGALTLAEAIDQEHGTEAPPLTAGASAGTRR